MDENGKLDKRKMLKEVCDFETCQELEYISWVTYEALRFSPPASTTSNFVALEDFTTGKLEVKKDDVLCVQMYALHRNANEWQRHNEFLPERFNPESELFLTPSGSKRNPYSWIPFSAGKRICFGKTFAELSLKIIGLYIT